MCYRLILYQAFIQTYPTMATYYLALAYNQASGQARTRIMGGQGTRKMSFAFLLFAGYFSMYCVNLWLQWSYWLRLGNGRTRDRQKENVQEEAPPSYYRRRRSRALADEKCKY